MEDLFTFNSEQFNNIKKRAQTAQHPTYPNKKNIRIKYCKKLTRHSQDSTNEDFQSSKIQKEEEFSKKVLIDLAKNQSFHMFHYPDPQVEENLLITLSNPLMKKHRSCQEESQKIIFNRYKQNSAGLCHESMVKRSYSMHEKQEKMEQTTLKSSIIEKQPQRRKRILSHKLQPKICIQTGSKKLPLAFKIKCHKENHDNNHQKSVRKCKYNSTQLKTIETFKTQSDNSRTRESLSSYEKLRRLMYLQNKFLEKMCH